MEKWKFEFKVTRNNKKLADIVFYEVADLVEYMAKMVTEINRMAKKKPRKENKK